MAPAKSKADPTGMDDLIGRVMRAWNIPGVAVAGLRDGKVVLCKGYGWRDLEARRPVTPETVFPIASVTKAFTTLLMGMLVDEGKLAWDQPVRDYLPEFSLHDPLASARATPRDLVCHRTGLPRHDNMWDFTAFSRPEIFARLRHLPLSRDFRAAYQYNNLMFMTAGVLVERLTGRSWEENVRERIFAPLGMGSSAPVLPDVLDHPELVTPYLERNGRLRAVPPKDFTSCGPAGTICSTAADMLQWVRFHLAGGKVGRRRLIEEKTLRQMHSPQMVVPGPHPWKEIPMSAYGLGWLISTYRGYRRIQHGGAIDGIRTVASFLPDEGLGIVVLTNKHDHTVMHAIEYGFYDRMLGLDPIDWNRRQKRQWVKMKERQATEKKRRRAESHQHGRPTRRLSDYTGDYEHPGYGPLRIERRGGDLHLTLGRFSSPLRHRCHDTWEFHESVWDNDYTVRFEADAAGGIATAAVPLEPSVAPIVFTRQESN